MFASIRFHLCYIPCGILACALSSEALENEKLDMRFLKYFGNKFELDFVLGVTGNVNDWTHHVTYSSLFPL